MMMDFLALNVHISPMLVQSQLKTVDADNTVAVVTTNDILGVLAYAARWLWIILRFSLRGQVDA